MKCSRCTGMMIYEDPHWRCLMCGELIDQTIVENRDYQNHGGEWDKKGKKWGKTKG